MLTGFISFSAPNFFFNFGFKKQLTRFSLKIAKNDHRYQKNKTKSFPDNNSGTEDIFPNGNVQTAFKNGHYKKMPMVVGWNKGDTYGWAAEALPGGIDADQYINLIQVSFNIISLELLI